MARPPSQQKSRTQILEELTSFMKRHPGPADAWYAGTAENARDQLFKVHGFKDGDVGLFRTAASDADASSLVTLLVKRGAKGDGATKPHAKSIYVFKMAGHTKPAT